MIIKDKFNNVIAHYMHKACMKTREYMFLVLEAITS